MENIPAKRDPRSCVLHSPYFADEETEARGREVICLGSTQAKMENFHKVRLLDQISRNKKLEKRKKKVQIGPQIKD